MDTVDFFIILFVALALYAIFKNTDYGNHD